MGEIKKIYVREFEEWLKVTEEIMKDMEKQINSYRFCNGIFILAALTEYEGYEFEQVYCNDKE